jgi:uncharacterized membrane protein YciS (DUF1049 family)
MLQNEITPGDIIIIGHAAVGIFALGFLLFIYTFVRKPFRKLIRKARKLKRIEKKMKKWAPPQGTTNNNNSE